VGEGACTPSDDGGMSPARRRMLMAATAATLGILALFPRHYVARAVIAPPISMSESRSTFGTLGAHSGMAAGARQVADPMIIATAKARSAATRDAVIATLGSINRTQGDTDAARRAFDAITDVHPLAGGMIEIVTVGRDAPMTLAVTRAYAAVIRDDIAPITGGATIVDTAHLETTRQFNSPAIALLGVLALFAFFVECRTDENGPQENQ